MKKAGLFLKASMMTIGIVVLAIALSKVIGFPLLGYTIFLSALWVAYDSKELDLCKYHTKIPYKPWVLFFFCLFLWLILFPAYLIVRSGIKNGDVRLKSDMTPEEIEREVKYERMILVLFGIMLFFVVMTYIGYFYQP